MAFRRSFNRWYAWTFICDYISKFLTIISRSRSLQVTIPKHHFAFITQHIHSFIICKTHRKLKSPHLTSEERKELSTERTKLSLYKPENYNSYFCKPINKTMSISRMNAFANEYPSFDLREYLPSIQTKTLIICGRYDVQCPVQYSIEIHDGIRNSIFIPFENSNHYPF